jgi:replication factor C subunit 1
MTCCSISGSKEAVNMDYLTHLRDSVLRPLIKEGLDGVPATLRVMQSYYLLRDDIDSLVELSLWPNQKDPMSNVESKVMCNCSSVIMYHVLILLSLLFIRIVRNKEF